MDQQAMDASNEDVPPRVSVPSLLHICCQVAASSDHWRYQRRYLDFLPEDIANSLLIELLRQHRLSKAPGYLSLFKRCVTSLSLGGREQHVRLDATWLAYVAELGQLKQLELYADGGSKVLDKALMPLTALHGSLQQLSLLRDQWHTAGFKLTDAVLASINQLTALQSLDLSGVIAKGPMLARLTGLSALTHLRCEDLPAITDEDCVAALPHFSALASLNLAGCEGVTDACFPTLAQLPALEQLDLSWSGCHSLPCFERLSVLRMRNSRLTSGEWCHTWLAERGGSAVLCLEEVDLSRCDVEAVEVMDALASLIRCSGRCLKTLNLSRLKLSPVCGDELLPLLLCLEATQHLQVLHMGNIQPDPRDEHLAAVVASGCTALKELDVSEWLITAQATEQLARLPALASLDLTCCTFGNAHLPALWQLTSLTRFELRDNHSTGKAPAKAASSAAEQVDGLAPGDIDGSDWALAALQEQQQQLGWACLKQLHRLNLNSALFSEAGFAALVEGVSSVRTLILSFGGHTYAGCGSLTAKRLASIGQLTKLRHLELELAPAVLPKVTVLAPLQYLTQLVIGPSEQAPLTPQAAASLRALHSRLPWLERMQVHEQPVEQALQAAQAAGDDAGASPGDSGPWQESSLRKQSGGGGSSSSKASTSSARGGSIPPNSKRTQQAQHGEQTPPSNTGGRGGPGASVPLAGIQLAAFDQRVKYTAQELLQLKARCVAAGSASGRLYQRTARELRDVLPEDLQTEKELADVMR